MSPSPADSASKPPLHLRSCTLTPLDPTPLFPPLALSAGAAAGAAADEDGDEASAGSDECGVEEGPRGFISPGSSTGIAVSGTVNAGLKRDDYSANALPRATELVPQSASSLPLSSTFLIKTGQTFADGRYLGNAFEVSVDTTS